MTDAEKVLLPVLEGTIEDWIRFRKEAWQVNKSHWAFWCGVIATWNLLQNRKDPMRKPNPTPRPTPPPQPDITIIRKGKPMSKLIILFVLFIIALQPIPPCGKFDRRRYIVAPICEPQPIKPIAPITGLW